MLIFIYIFLYDFRLDWDMPKSAEIFIFLYIVSCMTKHFNQ